MVADLYLRVLRVRYSREHHLGMFEYHNLDIVDNQILEKKRIRNNSNNSSNNR